MSHQRQNNGHALGGRQKGESETWIAQIDPRARIVASLVFACTVVSLNSLSILACCLAIALVLLLSTRLPLRETVKKILVMDGFIIFILCMLPFTTPGEPVFHLGSYAASKEGFVRAFEILFKANAIVMTLLALVSTIDTVVLGHALSRLKVPENLVHLMLFSVRYIDVLKTEYMRLRTAMKARCFVPGNNMHTYRSIGYLLGMMLVRSLERSERILEAMKCRGFQGRFYLLSDFHFRGRDRVFSLLCLLLFAGLVSLEVHYG